LWLSFDAACTTAYSPAAEHFKKLAEERQLNAEKARLLIAEVKRFASTINIDATGDTVDWKAVASFCMKMPSQWQKLGAIGRKEKKQLDDEFKGAMQALLDPLAAQRAIEIKQREKLIAELGGLDPHERNALDNVRSLQEQWQARAKSLPLEHKDEQALWLRFRQACDQIFAKRKEIASAADADRKHNLQAKEALCAELELAVNADDKDLAGILRGSKEAWKNIGAVPRVSEGKIEKRYKDAVASLQKKLDGRKKRETEAEFVALESKLALCSVVEKALVDGTGIEADVCQGYQDEWDRLPVLRSGFERKMKERFDRSLAALKAGDRQYAVELTKPNDSLAREIMQLEIIMGIESPAELAKQRLQMQVEVLQSSLRSGTKAPAMESCLTQLVNLCATPSATDSRLMNRIKQLIAHCKHTVV
jgi:hypothetical protein